jgi:hypothetical protein
MSNRERIPRAAAEAVIAAQQKAAEKAAKKKKPAPEVRMKVVWEVRTTAGKVVKSFPYPEKAKAEAEVASCTRSTGGSHILRPTQVPMDE